jgi:hypothetical protein
MSGSTDDTGRPRGETFDAELDGHRLARQLTAVRDYMLRADGWRTLDEISRITGAPPASVSARLRDLRRPASGGYTVERRRRRPGGGLYEYRVSSPTVEL